MCLKYILVGLPSESLSLFPPPAYRFHSSIFIYGYKIHPPYVPSLPHSLCAPHSHWYGPHKRSIFFLQPFILFLIKCILIAQGGFSLVLQVCMYHACIGFISIYFFPILIWKRNHTRNKCWVRAHFWNLFLLKCLVEKC
jgi:hypothetical protein